MTAVRVIVQAVEYMSNHINKEIEIQKSNVVFSVFRCELIAIDEGLDLISSLPPTKEIWILTGSKNAVQHLANWHISRDFTGMNILKKN